MTKCEDEIMPYGKYTGKTLGYILANDARYLDYISDHDIRKDSLKAAIKEMCTKYAAQIEAAIE